MASNEWNSGIQGLFRDRNDLTIFVADEKCDEPQRLAVFFRVREVASGEPQRPPIRGIGAKLFENADYGDILQSVAGVFSVGYY